MSHEAYERMKRLHDETSERRKRTLERERRALALLEARNAASEENASAADLERELANLRASVNESVRTLERIRVSEVRTQEFPFSQYVVLVPPGHVLVSPQESEHVVHVVRASERSASVERPQQESESVAS